MILACDRAATKMNISSVLLKDDAVDLKDKIVLFQIIPTNNLYTSSIYFVFEVVFKILIYRLDNF